MEGIHVWMNFESLQIARTYLFGEVKYLDLLLILSILDVITGIIKAWKMKQLEAAARGLDMCGRCSVLWWSSLPTLLIR